MPWKQISFSKNEWQKINSEIKLFRKPIRFLIDENVPDDLTVILKKEGYDRKTIAEFRLKSRDDKVIFDLARKENLVIITQDKDFLNDRLFPIQKSLGIAVLPACSENDNAFVTAFGNLLTIHGKSHELWNDQKVHFPDDDTAIIRFQNALTGRLAIIKFKFPKNGIPMVWENE